MKREYIDKLGISYSETPQGWNAADSRQDKWKEARTKYGFDERETWSLYYTMDLFLYERLMMYKEVNCVDLEFHKFKYKDEILTLKECIDRMIKGLELDLIIPEYDKKRMEDKEIMKAIDDVYPIYSLCRRALWW